MGQLKERCEPDSCDYWAVSKAAGSLTNQACTLSARHIKDGTLRLQFNREVSYYARGIVNDVAQGRKSVNQGLKAIKSEQSSLLNQSWEIAKKGAGAIAGGMQIIAGAGICYGSAGTLCLVGGIPMMAHGANNIYENGRNLLEDRNDTEGPTRKFYQTIAKWAGKTDREGNIAYGSADIATSIYGLFRLTLKPDAWRLFRYVRTDYVRSYKNMGKSSIGLEVHTNVQTINQLQQEVEK
ncbi:DUF4225 domain-containing protein [Pseudomonas frederiksbergensis]|uniref:DUF4225 domain-containing protein n=1 Tax=Pseudomonas frederiksbergensis TaxID=104087 RepID=A0A6L5C765_9PSED|nr:DUF4225 domain-containing protein [Pseudomonas frederiksbergensis]KAF2395274.1 hypothetical protein FX983_03258 [Pseudomonas frederiksbergensis]